VKNMDKQKLIAIFNALMQIETKGQSTRIMADCLMELERIINEPVEEKGE